jgi:hypothetical protein
MSNLGTRVQNSLDETRMLILGAQVLLGFQFQATLQPGFDRLPEDVQALKVVGLALMLVAVGLLLAPGAFHQIVERGNDSTRVTSFTTRIAALALLPFAVGMAIDVYVATFNVLGSSIALPAAAVAVAFALLFWYGLEWIVRARVNPTPQENEPMLEQTKIDDRIRQVLTEARVVLPGVQALLGFQFAAILTEAFTRLPKSSQVVHLISLGLIAAAIVFLMAPAAFHRLVERGEDTERMHRFASVMLLCAMVPLAIGIALDFYVVLLKVLESPSLAIGLAVVSLIFFFGLWFGLTLFVRASGQRPPTLQSVRQTRAA